MQIPPGTPPTPSGASQIDGNSPWRCPPRISRDAFRGIFLLTRADMERDPGEYYDYIVSRGVDPLYILAQFYHESTLGMTGVAVATHSWGNTRLPNFGISYATPTVAGRSGVFPVFNNWMDGLIATVERYLAPTWYYHDRPTIASIFINDGPVWAPAGDLNDPNGYLSSVLAYMNAHADGGTVSVPYDRIHTAADVGPTRAVSDVKWFVVHDTEGSFPGDESVLTDAAAPVESVHFLVGRTPGECVYMVPLGTTAWTAGNDAVGEQAIQVELSRNPAKGETDYTDYQYSKLAEIFNWCVSQGMVNVPAVYIGRVDADGGPEPDIPGIIGHQDVPDGAGGWGGTSHHTDPGPNFDWGRFVATIKGGPAPVPPADPFLHLNGFVVGGGFRSFYEATPLSAQTFGLPLSNETQATVTEADGTSHQRTVQFFERAIFQFEPGNQDPWRVTACREDQLVEELS